MKRSSIGVPPRPCTSNTPSRPPRMYWLRSGICPPFLPPSSWGNSPRTLGSLSCSVIAHAHPICHAYDLSRIRFVTHTICHAYDLSRDLSHADCYMPISYNLSLTTDLSRPSLSRPSTHPPCHYHNPLGAPGTRTLKIHRPWAPQLAFTPHRGGSKSLCRMVSSMPRTPIRPRGFPTCP